MAAKRKDTKYKIVGLLLGCALLAGLWLYIYYEFNQTESEVLQRHPGKDLSDDGMLYEYVNSFSFVFKLLFMFSLCPAPIVLPTIGWGAGDLVSRWVKLPDQ